MNNRTPSSTTSQRTPLIRKTMTRFLRPFIAVATCLAVMLSLNPAPAHADDTARAGLRIEFITGIEGWNVRAKVRLLVSEQEANLFLNSLGRIEVTFYGEDLIFDDKVLGPFSHDKHSPYISTGPLGLTLDWKFLAPRCEGTWLDEDSFIGVVGDDFTPSENVTPDDGVIGGCNNIEDEIYFEADILDGNNNLIETTSGVVVNTF